MKNGDIKKAIKWFENSCEPPCSEKCVQCKYEKMALDALREKEAREQGCEYCIVDSGGFGKNIIEGSSSEEGVYFTDNPDGQLTLTENYSNTDSAVVNFCPMCGRKLANDKEADK